MDLVITMIISIGIKALSAILEIGAQMLITNEVGVSEYGSYMFYVSLIEGSYYVLFSGSIKMNTFYLSSPEITISDFKKKYLVRFVAPIVVVIIAAFALMHNYYGMLSGVILFIYYCAFDRSSMFLARGKQIPSLLGEYFFGRLVLLCGLLLCINLSFTKGIVFLALYGLQFVTMICWYAPFNKKIKPGNVSVSVSFRKLFEYQVSDIATSLISYSPTILQYIIGGAFTAGFTGIITIVKKFINFISGPTAKVFLPEFSRLYKDGEKEKLKQSYIMIVRIQMVFIGTIGALLIGFPDLILSLFSPELKQYSNVFIIAAICLLVIAGIGPVTGLLQMTGNEKICNYNQWISITLMVMVWVVLKNEPLFAVYGLCVQAVVEGGLKYWSVCRWFGTNVVPLKNYLLMWSPVIIERMIINHNSLQYSYIACFVSVAIIFVWNTVFALRDPMIKDTIKRLLHK